MERGSFKMARGVGCPTMLSVMWMDNKLVHFLSTGASDCSSTANISKRGETESVGCPKLVSDYYRHMGGVDHHD